jgi:30S ribosomal protein S31
MGKGDKKTRKGKIMRGSYGVSRPRKSNEKKQKEAKGS